MKSIQVQKVKLLETLRKNRDQHRDIFLAAQEVYRKKWIEELERRLDDARNGRKIVRAFALPEPEDFTEEFDTAIQMLEWQIGETVELTPTEFDQYVLNKWNWNQRFRTNSVAYTDQA